MGRPRRVAGDRSERHRRVMDRLRSCSEWVPPRGRHRRGIAEPGYRPPTSEHFDDPVIAGPLARAACTSPAGARQTERNRSVPFPWSTMVDQLAERTVAQRPTGARAAAREDAILDAALALVLEVGYDKMSIDAVAERAHAGKATIYRHFPDKATLVACAISSRTGAAASEPVDTGSLREDLLAFGTSEVSAAGLDGGIFAGLLNASRTSEGLRRALLSQRSSETKQPSRVIVERAVARGELSDSDRVSLVCEVACSVVLHRLFVEHERPGRRISPALSSTRL